MPRMYHTTGFTKAEITELYARIEARELSPRMRRWPPILGLRNALTVTLTYLRRNRVQAEIAENYGVWQPAISRAISAITPLLVQALLDSLCVMTGPVTQRQAALLIERCYAGLDAAALREEVLRRIRRIVSVDAAFFGTVDPATLLFTSAVAEEPLQAAGPLFMENEFARQDVNKFAVLAESGDPVGSLDRAAVTCADDGGVNCAGARRSSGLGYRRRRRLPSGSGRRCACEAGA